MRAHQFWVTVSSGGGPHFLLLLAAGDAYPDHSHRRVWLASMAKWGLGALARLKSETLRHAIWPNAPRKTDRVVGNGPRAIRQSGPGESDAGDRRQQRPGADRKPADSQLVSRLRHHADDSLCRLAAGAARAHDDGHALCGVAARGQYAGLENGLSARHSGDARQCAENADGQIA